MENSSNPELGAHQTSAGKAGARRDEVTRQERHDMVWLRDAVLPDDGPADDIYRLAVPILCKATHEDLAEKLGPEYACGVAYGIERGLILANLKPEWARGLYQLLLPSRTRCLATLLGPRLRCPSRTGTADLRRPTWLRWIGEAGGYI